MKPCSQSRFRLIELNEFWLKKILQLLKFIQYEILSVSVNFEYEYERSSVSVRAMYQ